MEQMAHLRRFKEEFPSLHPAKAAENPTLNVQNVCYLGLDTVTYEAIPSLSPFRVALLHMYCRHLHRGSYVLLIFPTTDSRGATACASLIYVQTVTSLKGNNSKYIYLYSLSFV